MPVQDRMARRKRTRRIRTLLLVIVLLAAGALLEPAFVAPFGPTAMRPERVTAQFARCARGRTPACVIDGDTFRLGGRSIRIGIDAPEIAHPSCPAERALGERAANRLVDLLNRGDVDLIGHRFVPTDQYGRDLRVVKRGDASLGAQLIDEGLAHRYLGSKRSWC